MTTNNECSPALKKLGVIFNPAGNVGWMKTHAYLPTAILLEDSRIRIFLAFRDGANIGRVGWIDVSSSNPTHVLEVSKEPCLDVGQPGCFDDNGVSPLSIVRTDNQLRLYYAGWQLTPRVRYLLFTGMAISDDGGLSFRRSKRVPVLDRSDDETLVRSGAFIIYDEGIWKAWYAAGSSTVNDNNRIVPTYDLVYAESSDGVDWPDKGEVILRPCYPDEYGFGRPAVLKRHGRFEMYYSIRSHSQVYTIGNGVSDDGRSWKRLDNIRGLHKSVDGWDSQMIGFASIVNIPNGKTFLFYNGNNYGESGVGVAEFLD